MGDDLMSNMLEQAIADAAALREQAIKNAEQSVLDKYSKQIKEAVDQMLEMDDAPIRAEEMIAEAEDEIMQEEDAGMGGAAPAGESATIEAPGAYDSRPGSEDVYVKMSAMLDNLPFDDNDEIELDFGDLDPEPIDLAQGAQGASDDLGGLDMGTPDDGAGDDLGGDLDLGGDDLGGGDDLDLQLQEVLSMLEEEDEALEEAMHIDQRPEDDALGGVWRHNKSREQFNADMAKLLYGDEESEEESEDVNEELMGHVNDLHETVDSLTQQNSQLERVLTKLEIHLEESLLSNAKLLYQNRTLADASLNERQKSKIVEAIANAESPKEAKKLHETLKATVGSTPNSKRDPQSLSESVNRRSNLSSMLNSRQNINESKQSADPFKEKMQKLAGIKK
tara:strand:+ start:830 stop:2008 length:1179 start_codon:yes stop_codon:yes gene_type:complete